MDLADAECLLADLVLSCEVVAFISEECDAAGAEGGVSRIDEVDFGTEAR